MKLLSHKTKIIIIIVAFLLLTILSISCVFIGTVEVSLSDLLKILNGQVTDGYLYQIISNVRIPRIISGILVGMNLAVAGVLLQGVLRNPMASPNIIGVNAGAGLMAVILMTLLPSQLLLLPIVSFVGALAASLLIYGLSSQQSGRASTVHIVLAGVAISAFLNSITSGIMMLNTDVLDITYSWMLGSLSGRSWTAVQSVLPYSIIGLLAALFLAPKINLFTLGDEMASSIGLKTNRYRVIIIIISAILAGSAVSVAGAIGFVGLVAPHVGRLIIGNDHKYLIPISAVFGAILLVVSDTVARTIFQPVELSVGIVTGILGAPFFLLLLYRNKGNI
jgi:iron complex transport system permease protein